MARICFTRVYKVYIQHKTWFLIYPMGRFLMDFSTSLHNTHVVTLLPIPAKVYHKNTLDSQLCWRGRGKPSILNETFYKSENYNWASLKKFKTKGLSGETLKFCLDFYVIRALHKKILAKFESFSRKSIWLEIFVSYSS